MWYQRFGIPEPDLKEDLLIDGLQGGEEEPAEGLTGFIKDDD